MPFHATTVGAGGAQRARTLTALSTYEKLRRDGLQPGLGVILAAITFCRNTRDLENGRRIHREVSDSSGHHLDSLVANSLLDMYAKCGSMASATELFQSMKRKDVVSWTCMILGYAKDGEAELALELYTLMQEQGCSPDRVTLLAALKACSVFAEKECTQPFEGKLLKVKSLERGRALHSHARKAGYVSDTVVANTLLDMYKKCHSMEDATQVFQGMRTPDVVSWTSMISGNVQTGNGDRALELYSLMQARGCKPDRVTALAVLKACASLAEGVKDHDKKLELMEMGKGVYQAVNRKSPDEFLENSLLDMYAKCGNMKEAHRVFESMRRRSSVSWKCMVLGYVQNGEHELALKLYNRMKTAGCSPDQVTVLAVLKACACVAVSGGESRSRCLERAAYIYQSELAETVLDIQVANSLIDLYAKCDCMELSRGVFESVRHRSTTVSWNCIILGYTTSGEPDVSLKLYLDMRRESNCSPDSATFVAVLKACGCLAALDFGRQVYAEIQSLKLDKDLLIANALVDFFGKCGSLVDAERVFSSVPSRDLVTWSSLVAGYSSQGQAERVFELVERMESEEKLQPDGVLFLSILAACSHAGLVVKGREYFETMVSKYGISPAVEHYTCMVDLHGRKNQLVEAERIIRSMSCREDVVIWKALLGACWKWKNVEVGRVAFEAVAKLDGSDGAAYNLMANIYSACEMVKEAGTMRRKTRRELEQRSWWTDDHGVAHMFQSPL